MGNPSTVWAQLSMPNPPAGSVPFVASDNVTIITDVTNFNYNPVTKTLTITAVNTPNITCNGVAVFAAVNGGAGLALSNNIAAAPGSNYQSSLFLGINVPTTTVTMGNLLLESGIYSTTAITSIDSEITNISTITTGINEICNINNLGSVSGTYYSQKHTFTNDSAGTANAVVGTYYGLTNTNTAFNPIHSYTAIYNAPIAGGGTTPASNSFITNADPSSFIATLGPVNIGAATAPPVSSNRLVVNGADNLSNSFPFVVKNQNGTSILFTDNLSTTTAININLSGVMEVNGIQVVGVHATGWVPMTGTLDNTSVFATGSVTLIQLAERVAALQAALTTHGLIGV